MWRVREKKQTRVTSQLLAHKTMAGDPSPRGGLQKGQVGGAGAGGPVWAGGAQRRCPRAATVTGLAFKGNGLEATAGTAGENRASGRPRTHHQLIKQQAREPRGTREGEKGPPGRERGD